MLIGVCGPARSGKGTIEKYLCSEHGFHADSFAAPIRKTMVDLLCLDNLEHLEIVKDKPHFLLGGKTPRYAMQTMGTEWGRQMVDQNLWINTCLHRSSRFANVVLSDVRFDNEAAAVIKAKGLIIKVVRPGVEIAESSHASERGVSDSFVSKTFINAGSIGELESQIKAWLSTQQETFL